DGRGSGACAGRIFVATVAARLTALDARTGRPCESFGEHGHVDLTRGLRHQPEYHWEYGVTSPPLVVGDLVLVGSAVPDNHRVDAPEGVIRAFDVRSGAVRWRFDPIPRQPHDTGYETWIGPTAHNTGAANAWSIFSADPARDLVFIPVGSASPDFYGGERRGDNHFANSVVALRASTGRFVWAFQVVHHDLWDYDVPAQPVLFALRRGSDSIPAVAVATKMRHLFILDRRSGVPLFPVEERPVPTSDVPGEVASPTQPFPPSAFRLVPESLAAGDAFAVTDSMRAACRARIAALRYEGVFTPPSRRGTIIWPGNLGGMNWSGVSVDERRGIVIAPTNRLAMVVTLIPRDSLHAAHMAHPDLEFGRQAGTPYGMSRDHLGICTPPPWGTLTALDLSAGTVKWQVPLGAMPQLAQVPQSAAWGSFNLGGALLTASGLVFIAGTFDQHLRAFDVETGRELWSAALPAAGHALPMTYVAEERQYVVVAAGGHHAGGARCSGPRHDARAARGRLLRRDAHRRRALRHGAGAARRWRLVHGEREHRLGADHRSRVGAAQRAGRDRGVPARVPGEAWVHRHSDDDATAVERRAAARGRRHVRRHLCRARAPRRGVRVPAAGEGLS
ncbi:MAG: hypothetical protein AUH12_06290, partial [Gemmatimonadetes bacterium 13_2_20CM_69_8]